MIKWKEVFSIFYVVFGLVAAICLIVGAIVLLSWKLANWSCQSYSTETGRETKFGAVGVCYVKRGDVWYTLNEYKYIQVMENKQ